MATAVRIYFSNFATNRTPLTEATAQRYGMITSSPSPKFSCCAAVARAPCTLALVRHIDAIDLNARWFTAQRYHAAAGATNEVILHLDDDLLPGEATLQLLVGK